MAMPDDIEALELALGRIGEQAPLPDERRLAAILLQLEARSNIAVVPKRRPWLPWLLLGVSISAAAAVVGYQLATAPEGTAGSSAIEIEDAVPDTSKPSVSGPATAPAQPRSDERGSGADRTDGAGSSRRHGSVIYIH